MHAAVLRGEHTQAARTLAPRPALLALAGRSAELAELHEAWTQASAGRGGVVLLTGLPGAGKTRLAEELAETVAATGGTVLSARCYEAERGLFLQPFVEAISRAAARWPAARIRAAVTAHGDSLARLVPEVVSRSTSRSRRAGAPTSNGVARSTRCRGSCADWRPAAQC